MVKTAVLVSGGGLNLQSLLDAKLFGELPECEITAVISSRPDAYALMRAEAALVPTYIIDRELFPNESVFAQAVSDKLKDLDIELIVIAGFDHKLPSSVFKRFSGRIIDTCPMLPNSEDEQAGASAFFVTENAEERLYIISQTVDVEDYQTPEARKQRLLEEGENVVLPKAVSLFCTGQLRLEDGSVHILCPEQEKQSSPCHA